MADDIVVNGKIYRLWQQFVHDKKTWIGGRLESWEDGEHFATTITDIRLEPNGKESAAFFVDGKDFGCGADVHVLGIMGDTDKTGLLMLSGYGGHRFGIGKHETTKATT